MVHQRPKTPQGETVAKPCTLLLMIRSIIYGSAIEEVHGELPNQLLKRMLVERIIVGIWMNAETVSHILIVSY